MAPAAPYQPALLRVLHGGIATLGLCAFVTGFWVYNTYDRRWGSLALPPLQDIQGIHGTIALGFLLLLPVFALYCFRVGHRRLVQPNTPAQLAQLPQAVGWVALHRLTTTLCLVAATGAVITGRMMKEEWLPSGDLHQAWYIAHLLTWAGVGGAIALHALMGIKVGGVPLILSMVQWQMRSEDAPRSWVPTWLQGLRNSAPPPLRGLEILILGGILLAFLLPALP
jgi:hypothetical protein